MAAAADDGDWSCACVRKRVSVTVRRSSGQRVRVEARVAGTIEELKGVVAEWFDVPVAAQKLIHKGRILENDRRVGSYGEKKIGSIFTCMLPSSV
uniref:Ubiquitin-like domain-containing protein n=1 Tax=Kalanchoe fedtschenkoi TaxID=63787 RepID=A0A7N0U832_KALFE